MPLEPSDAELLTGAIQSALLDVHTCMPCVVKSYDAATQRADVVPVVRRELFIEDERVSEDLPPLMNVPVVFPRAGGFSLQFPLEPGDHVLVVFSESATAQWEETGSLSDPHDLARHSLSYGFAIPGIAPRSQPLAAPAPGEAVLTVKAGGVLRVSEAAGAADFVALAAKVDAWMASIAAAFNVHIHLSAAPGSPTGGPLGPAVPPDTSPGPRAIDNGGSVAATTLKVQ